MSLQNRVNPGSNNKSGSDSDARQITQVIMCPSITPSFRRPRPAHQVIKQDHQNVMKNKANPIFTAELKVSGLSDANGHRANVILQH